MRLFIGIDLPADARQSLERAAAAMQTFLRTRAPRVKVRWVDAPNLHVTVAFLGQVDGSKGDALGAALAAPLEQPAFGVRLSALGAFPSSGPARVIWAGFDAGTNDLVSVHRLVYERLRPLGFEPDARAYSPHVTLDRVKTIDGRGSRVLRDALAAGPHLSCAFTVHSATLFRSHLSPAGSRYEALLRVPLR